VPHPRDIEVLNSDPPND